MVAAVDTGSNAGTHSLLTCIRLSFGEKHVGWVMLFLGLGAGVLGRSIAGDGQTLYSNGSKANVVLLAICLAVYPAIVFKMWFDRQGHRRITAAQRGFVFSLRTLLAILPAMAAAFVTLHCSEFNSEPIFEEVPDELLANLGCKNVGVFMRHRCEALMPTLSACIANRFGVETQPVCIRDTGDGSVKLDLSWPVTTQRLLRASTRQFVLLFVALTIIGLFLQIRVIQLDGFPTGRSVDIGVVVGLLGILIGTSGWFDMRYPLHRIWTADLFAFVNSYYYLLLAAGTALVVALYIRNLRWFAKHGGAKGSDSET